MFKKGLFKYLPVFVTVALIVLLVCPVRVFAEGEGPSTDPTPIENAGSGTSAEETAPAEPQPAVTVEPAESVTVEKTAAPEGATTEVTAEPVLATENVEMNVSPTNEVDQDSKSELADVVTALEETGTVIVDESGGPIPLATNTVVEILKDPDPWVCSAASDNPAGDSNCTSYTGINAFTRAVNAALPGNFIYVEPGTYTEWNSSKEASIVIDKPLSVFGMDKNTTIIQGPNSATDFSMSYGTLLLITASDVTISGFTFSGAAATQTNTYGATSYGIVVKPPNGTTTLSNITITDNIFTFIGDSGVQLQSVEHSTIKDNEFKRETRSVWHKPAGATPGSLISVTRGGSGPGLWSSKNVLVANNLINTSGVGIFVYGGNKIQIIGNIVSGISTGGVSDEGIHIQSSTNARIENNEVSGFLGGLVKYYNQGKSGSGILVYADSSVTIRNNYIHDNSIGILVPASNATASPSVTLKDNIIINNVADGLVNIKYPASGSWAWWDESGNPMYRRFTPGDLIKALYNYWGCDGGPGTPGCNTIVGNASHDPWLKDTDGDGVFESSNGTGGYKDNCPAVSNADQLDSDGDGVGNACESTPFEYPPTVPVVGGVAGAGGIVPVTSGELVTLSNTAGTALQLSGGAGTIFNAPMGGFSASLTSESSGTLPGSLPSGSTFLNGLTLNLTSGGTSVNTLTGGATLTASFPIPAGMKVGTFTILHWDASNGKWMEVPVTIVDGYVQITVEYTGTFVLVSK